MQHARYENLGIYILPDIGVSVSIIFYHIILT